ncbi:MAG: putative amidophosphoribosyltransferase [Bacteroidetes bacterium]|nr:putative amidophosphoribosyltransferase [Bacteroidota bacterium]
MLPRPRLTRVFTPLIEFIYPPTCFVCEALMDDHESRVCVSCWANIRDVGPDDPLHREMQRRLTESSQVSNLISLYHFEKDGTLQSIIHQLKYEGMTRLGVELGRKLGERIETELNRVNGIVPVPLHPTKLRERGYNQSEYIAKGIREVIAVPVYASLLKRHKYTSSQTQLNAVERKENVGDAFSLNKRYLLDVEGKTFLVVDDVITTGATIEACAVALMNAHAQSVIACSVAIAEHSV